MIIDFSKQLFTRKGDPMKESMEPEAKIATLGSVCIAALDSTTGAGNLAGKDKYRRGWLADRIFRAKAPISIKAEDLVTIKELVGQAFSPIVVKQAWDILDPQEEEKDGEALDQGGDPAPGTPA